MIFYNTTFTFHNSLRGSVSEWLRVEWIPSAEEAGMTGCTVARLLVDIDPDATAFAVQGRFASEEAAEAWRDGDGAGLLERLHARYGEGVLPFSTMMEVIDL